MEEAARCFILLVTFCLIIALIDFAPRKVPEPVKVDYCQVTYWTWVEEPPWPRRKVWYPAWGPCFDQDEYKEA